MEGAGLGQGELADRLNQRIEDLTGKPGALSDRHIRHWLTGKTRWPQMRQRIVLEEEFGVSVEELGFSPRLAVPLHHRRMTTCADAPSLRQPLPSRPPELVGELGQQLG